MSLTVFFAVLLAALFHAGWNALVKGGADKDLAMCGVVVGQMVFGAAVLPFVPAPDPAGIPYLLVGLLLHFGYQLFLLNSYRTGDLTQVYPIARGSAPLIVTAVSVLALGVVLRPMELLAVAMIAGGIVSIALVRQADGLRNRRAAVSALITGCFIASYSLVDGYGARISGTALGFYGWLTIGNALVFILFTLLTAPARLPQLASGPGLKATFLGGGASFVAYAIVTWAFTQAPIALVTALRETSIVFALMIGVFFLGERLSLPKVVSVLVTLAGVVLLRLAA